MTVDEHDMSVLERARRANNDNGWVEQRWRELPELTGARRENWMADRAKNAMGTAKLASVYLDQERGRIGRLRKTKSVLASGKFIGKNPNKRRHRPCPSKANHPQNQCHGRWPETYGQLLPDSSLPSLNSRTLSHTIGNASASGLPTIPVPMLSSRENLIDRGNHNSGYVLHGESAASPSAWDVSERANPSLTLQIKGGQLRSIPPRGATKVDPHSPYVPGDLFDHDVHRRSKDGLSQQGCSPSSLGLSAIDLFDQSKLLPEPAVELKEEQGRPQPPNCSDTNDCGSGDLGSDKPPAVMGWLESNASTVRSLPLPDCASIDSSGAPCHEQNSSYHETRACNTATQNRFSSAFKPPAIADVSSPAYSRFSEYQRSPERWKGVVKMIQRGESETAEAGILGPRLLDPVPVKAKAPPKSERVRHGGNTSQASPPISLTTTATVAQKHGGDAKGTSSEQRLVDALARLKKNKDLDALRSEYKEALSILQRITGPTSATSRTTIDEDSQKVNDVAVQVAKMRKKSGEQSEPARESSGKDIEGDALGALDSKSAAAPGVEFVPADEGVEVLSTNLPRIGSRDQDALRLLYRKWWMQIATGGSVSCLPEPSEFSSDERPTQRVAQNRRTELFEEGGGKRREANLGTEAFVRVQLRRNCAQDASTTTQKDVAIATEVEFPGSIGDAMTTLFASLGMWQPSAGEMREERRINSASGTGSSSDVGRRLQVENDCTGDATSVAPLSPRASTHGTVDDAGHTSHYRTSARANSLGSTAGLTRDEKNSSGRTRRRQTSLDSAIARQEPLEYPSGKLNQALRDVRRAKEEEQPMSRCCQETIPVAKRRDVAVMTKAESLGSLVNITRSPSSSLGIQLTSVGVGTERRRRGTRAIRRSPDISWSSQGASEGTETTNSAAPTPSRTCTCSASQVAGLSSRGYSGGNLVCKKPSGYNSNQPNQVSSEAKKSEDDVQAEQRFFKGSSKASTRKDVAVMTKTEFSRSFGDILGGLPAYLGVQLTLVEVRAEERRRSGARFRRGISDTDRRALCGCESGIIMTSVPSVYLSLPIITRGAPHVVHHMSCGRTKAQASNCDSTAGFALQQSSVYAGNQPDRILSSCTCRREDEEQAIPRCSKDVANALTRKDVAVTAETDSPGSLGDIFWGHSTSFGVQLTLLGIETEARRCSSVRDTRSSSDAGGRFQAGSGDVEAAASVSLISLFTTSTWNVTDPNYTSDGRTRARVNNNGSTEDFARNVPRGCMQNQLNEASSHASREKEEEQEVPRCSQVVRTITTQSDVESLADIIRGRSASPVVQLTSVGTGTDGIRCSSVKGTGRSVGGCPQVGSRDTKALIAETTLSPPIVIRDVTEDPDHTSRGRMGVRVYNYGSAAGVTGREFPGHIGNTPNQSRSNARRGKEEQSLPRCSQDATTVTATEDVTITPTVHSPGSLGDVTGGSFASFEEQVTSAGKGTDEGRRSGVRAKGSSSNIGRPRHVASRESEAAISETLILLSPPTIPRGDIHNPHQTSRGRSGARAVESSFAGDFALHEPLGYTGNQFNQNLRESSRGKAEERTVSRGFQDVTSVITRKDVAVTTDTEPPGHLGDVARNPSASLGVQLNTVGLRADERRRIDVTASGKSLDVGGRPRIAIEDAEAVTSEILVYLSPPITTREASHDAHPTSCGRTRARAIDSGSAAALMLHEPSGYTASGPNQVLNNASRVKEEGQGVLRCSQDVTTTFKRKDIAIATEIESPGSFGDITSSPSASLRVQVTSVGVGAYEGQSSGVGLMGSIPDFGGSPQVASEDPEATPSRHLLNISPPTCARYKIDNGDDASRSLPRSRAFDSGSTVDIAEHEPSENSRNQPNQESSDLNRGKGQEEGVPRCSRNVTTALKLDDPAFATEPNSPGNVDVTKSPSAFFGVQFTSRGVGTDGRRCSSVKSTERNSDAGRRPQVARRDTEDAKSDTLFYLSPPTSTRDATDSLDHTSCIRTRAKSIHSVATVDSAEHDQSRYTRNPHNQASRVAMRGKEEEEAVPRCCQDVTMATKRKDIAVATEADSLGRLNDVTSSPSVSHRVQTANVGVGTSERRQYGATGSHTDADWCPQRTSESAGSTTSVTLLSPPITTRGATYDVHHTMRGRTRARATCLDLPADSARRKPLEQARNGTSHVLSSPTREKDDKQPESHFFQIATTASTRKDVSVATEAQLPRSFTNVTAYPSASRGVRPNSFGLDDHTYSRYVRVTRGSGARRRLHYANWNSEAAITLISQHTSTRDAMDDQGHTERDWAGTRAGCVVSAAGLARHEPWGYSGSHPNPASSDDKRSEEDERVVYRSSEDAATAPKRNDVAVTTEAESVGSLREKLGNSSALELQLSLLGVETDKLCRKVSKALGSSSDIGRRPEVACKDAEAKIAVTPVSPPTSTRDTTNDPDITCGRTTARARVFGPTEDHARHVPLGYSSNQPNQASYYASITKEEEEVIPSYSQEITTALTREHVEFDQEVESPRSVGGVTRRLSTSPGVQLISVGVNTDESRRNGSGEVTAVSMISPSIITGGDTHDAHDTTYDRTRPRAVSLGSAADLTLDDHTGRGRPTRARALSLDSAAGVERHETSKKHNQALSGVNQWKGGEQAVQRCLPASPGVQLISVGVNTDESRRNGSGEVTSVSMVSPSIITGGDTHDAHYTTYDRTRPRAVSLGSAADLTPDDHTGRGRRRRARALSLDSAAGVERHEPPAYTSKKPNQALSGVNLWKGGEQAVQRYLQEVSTVPMRTDVAISTKENPGDIMRGPSTSRIIRSTSVSLGMDERRRTGVSSKGEGLNVDGHTQIACENIEAMTSSTQVSPPTSIRDAMVDATITSCGRSIATAISSDSAIDFVRRKPSRYTVISPNQASSDPRQGTGGKEAVPRCSKEVTAANKQTDVAIAIETESSASLGDVVGIPSASPGVQLTSRVGTGEKRRSGTEVETLMTLVSRCAIHDAHQTNRGRKRARILDSTLSVDYTRRESSRYVGYQADQASSNSSRGQDEVQVVPRRSHEATTATARKDVDVMTTAESPESPGETMWGLSAFPGVQLASLGVGTDERRRSGASATGCRSDLGGCLQNKSKDTEAKISVSPVSQPTSTRNVTDEPEHTSCGCARASAINFVSAADFVRHNPLRSMGIPPKHASSDARRGKEREKVAPRCSQGCTTRSNRRDIAVATEAESSGSLGDVMRSRSASPGEQLTSVGVRTDERFRSGVSTTWSSSDVDEHPKDASGCTDSAISVTTVSPPTSIRDAADNPDHARDCRNRARALICGSTVDLAQHEPLGYTRIQPNQALRYASRGKAAEYAVPIRSQAAITATTRKDIAVTTETEYPGRFGDFAGSKSASHTAQLTSEGLETGERRRGGTAVATSSATLVSPPIIARGAIHDAHYNARGRTRASAISVNSAVALVREDHSNHCRSTRAGASSLDSAAGGVVQNASLGYTDSQPNQISNDARQWKGTNKAATRCSQGSTPAPTWKDFAVETKTESSRSLGDISERPSASPGVQLTSVGVGTDQRSRRGARVTRGSSPAGRLAHLTTDCTGVSTSSTLVYGSPVITRGASQDVHYSSHDRKKARALSRDLRTGSEQDDPSRYRYNQVNQTSDARQGKDQGQIVSWPSRETITALTPRVVTVATGTESSGSLDDVEDKPSASLGAELTSGGIETGETYRGDARAIGSSLDVGRRSQGAGEGTGVADSGSLQAPSLIIHDASYDAHHTTPSRMRASTRSRSCAARVTGRSSASYRHPQGMSEGTNMTLLSPPVINHNATDDIYATSHIVSEASAGGRGSPTSSWQERYFGGCTGNRPNQVLRDARLGNQDATISTTRRDTAITTQAESPRGLGDVLVEGSPSLGIHLTSRGVGTDERSRSAVTATGRSSGVGRRPRVKIGDAEAVTSMILVYLSPPLITRDATHNAHQNSLGRKRARAISFGPAITPHEPLEYMGSGPNHVLSNARRRKEGRQGVQRYIYSQDVTAASTRKYVAVAGKTESPRRLGIATSVIPVSPPTRTCKTTIHAGYTNRSRPATRGHAPGTVTGLGGGTSWGFAGEQTPSGARRRNDKKKGKCGVAKVDVDGDYVSEEDGLVPGEEEEGSYGRFYLSEGRFLTTLGLNPDRNHEDEDEVPTEDGINSEISWEETVKWNHGEDAGSLEYDDDDFEEL